MLRQNSDGTISYNKQLLAATVEVEDSDLLQRIRKELETDTINQLLRENDKLVKDESGLFHLHGLIYVPVKLREEVIKKHHDDLTHGHMGIEKTVEHISRNYYFPNMNRLSELIDIEQVYFVCESRYQPAWCKGHMTREREKREKEKQLTSLT